MARLQTISPKSGLHLSRRRLTKPPKTTSVAEQKFTIVFKRSPDYKIFTSPVVYGGPTPEGKGILINFCVDHAAFPSYVEHLVEGGKVNIQEINSIAQVGNVEREIQAGVYMSLDEAERTMIWLQDMLRKIRGGRDE